MMRSVVASSENVWRLESERCDARWAVMGILAGRNVVDFPSPFISLRSPTEISVQNNVAN